MVYILNLKDPASFLIQYIVVFIEVLIIVSSIHRVLLYSK